MHKILIIDDEEDSLLLLNKMLTRKGFEVHTLSTGSSAVEKAEQIHPDLILLDIRLDNGYDGRNICKQLKADPVTKNCKVFLSSAHVRRSVEYSGYSEDDFIPKPIVINELLNKISHHLMLKPNEI